MRQTTFRFPVTTLAGSSLKNIAALVDVHHVEPEYSRKLMLARTAAFILEPLTLLERMIWQKRLRDHRLKTPPVFIIGFWRSGTTLLRTVRMTTSAWIWISRRKKTLA